MTRMLILGDVGEDRVGGHLLEACHHLGVENRVADPKIADSFGILNKLSYHFLSRKPPRIRRFENEAIRICSEFNPSFTLTVGRVPFRTKAVRTLNSLGTKTIIWLTDDPWNPGLSSKWLMNALPYYELVLTPRKSNIRQLEQLCASRVAYLPFGFSNERHCKQSDIDNETDCDLLFVGGADPDRIPIIHSIIGAGLKIALYGGYWNRDPISKPFSRGLATPSELNVASSRSKIALILVRRANRDGHVMRTFEAAASGSCMLVEDTEEHRELFGPDGFCVRYFSDNASLIQAATELLANQGERNRLALSVRNKIVLQESHSYTSRLASILEGWPK